MSGEELKRAREIYWQYMEETAAAKGAVVAVGEREKCLRGDLDHQHGVQIALRALRAHPLPEQPQEGVSRDQLKWEKMVDNVGEKAERIASSLHGALRQATHASLEHRYYPLPQEGVRDRIALAIVKADAEAVEDEIEPTSQRWAEYIADAVVAALSQPGRGESGGWLPIETAPSERNRPSVLIFSPKLQSQPDYPGHAIMVSNIDYILCGNAKADGFTHWMPLPSTPSSKER